MLAWTKQNTMQRAMRTGYHSEVPFLSRSAPVMDDLVISNEGVTKLLKSLNPSKALRPGELHPRVLKELATELGPGFAYFCQKSLACNCRH